MVREAADFIISLPWGLAGLGACIGAIIGSFVATMVIRWPEERSFVAGRSRCDECLQPIAPRSLVPVISYLVQRGRCWICGAKVDAVHLHCELFAALIGGVSFLVLSGPLALAGAVFGWLLLTIGQIDARRLWIPTSLVICVAVSTLPMAFIGEPPVIEDRILGGTIAYLLLELVRLGYRMVRGREGMGAADPKLLGAIGLWIGLRWIACELMFSAGLALICTVLVMPRQDHYGRIPLGTFFALAAWPIWLLSTTGDVQN